MANKHFEISDERIEILNQVKVDNNLKTDVAAINFLLDSYQKEREKQEENKMLAELFVKTFTDSFHPFMERIRWATKTAEMNSMFLLDAVNTILLNQNISDCVPVETYMSPVIAASQEIYKEKLAYFKQQKDNRNLQRQGKI